MLITKVSALTGIAHTREIDITPEAFEAWREAGDNDPKRFVQVSFPHLSDDDREFLLTGVTTEEWEAFMPAEDEPEDRGTYDETDEADWKGGDL